MSVRGMDFAEMIVDDGTIGSPVFGRNCVGSSVIHFRRTNVAVPTA
jgi:hypothetical protein